MVNTYLDFFLQRFRAFRADEDGAATVDFVILTSSVVMLGLAHVKDVADGTVNIADDVSGCLGTDIANIVVDGDPNSYVANMQAVASACSAR